MFPAQRAHEAGLVNRWSSPARRWTPRLSWLHHCFQRPAGGTHGQTDRHAVARLAPEDMFDLQRPVWRNFTSADAKEARRRLQARTRLARKIT